MFRKFMPLFYIVCLILLSKISLYAQTDSLKLSLKETETLFIQNNLSLIAQNYNINGSKVLIDQAKYWDNPNISFTSSVYDDETKKFFSHNGSIGSYNVQLQQLIKTAGKRGKLIQLAQDDLQSQEINFKSLVQNLRYDLRTNFYSLYTLLQQNEIYKQEINALNTLINASNKQLEAGNVSVKENMRLKALLYGLQNDNLENLKQINECEAVLRTLLNVKDNTFISPVTDHDILQPSNNSYAELIDIAKQNSATYLLAQNDKLIALHQVQFQKSLAAPDVTIAAVFDRNNTYAPNVYSMGLSLPLPLFNRNKGNIRAAEFTVKNKETELNQVEQNLRNDIRKAWLQLQALQEIQNKSNQDFYEKYDVLMANVIKSYKERQIGLVEFIDFMDAYKDTKLKILQQHLNLFKAANDLNFAIGK